MTRVKTHESAQRHPFIFGAGLLAVAQAVTAGARPAAPSGDVQIMQGALAGEHAGIAAYRLAGASGLLQPDTLKVAMIFMGHHEQHRDALANLIRKAGGAPVEPKADADYVEELNLGALKAQADVVLLATKLELGAANAYAGQVAALRDPHLAHLFAQLSADEAVHWTTLNSAAGAPIPAKAFLFG
jgi:rubrerythrin